MLDDTWEAIALPIMTYVGSTNQFTGWPITVGDLADAVGASPEDTYEELVRLVGAGYLTAEITPYLGTPVARYNVFNPQLEERGARAVGKWPPEEMYDALLAQLERRLEATTDAEARGRLERFRTALADIGKSTASALLVEVMKGSLPHL
jgi:predicted ArsR family transcriptional regulator